MKIFKCAAIAFSVFSRIPMPQFVWGEDDMAGSFIFFPVIGVMIGYLAAALNLMAPFCNIPVSGRILLTMAIPLILTGGIHMDGFMDTEDALHSYAPAEKKLEILGDPHTGAFAVISLVKWMLVYGAAISILVESSGIERKTLLIFGLTFAMSRCCCGMSSFLLKKARSEGMLYELTKNKRRPVICCLAVELAVISGFMLYLDIRFGSAVLLTFSGLLWYYRYKMYKEFGGVTGDTAGYFITVSEIVSAVVLAILSVF